MLELRKTLGLHLWASLGAALLLLVLWAVPALADGTEELGTPSIAITPGGTGIMVAGVGIAEGDLGQPGTIAFTVDGAVVQALLYWEGANQGTSEKTDTDTISVDDGGGAVSVTGVFIGGNTLYAGTNEQPNGFVTLSYRADITALVSEGANTLVVDGIDFSQENDGVGVVVIFDDGTDAVVDLRDGNDYAHIRASGDLQVTVPQTFTFSPAAFTRTARLDFLVGSVADDTGKFGPRPSSIEVTVAGVTTTFNDLLNSEEGQFWDVVSLLPVDVPAGATELTVEVFSRREGGLPPNCDESAPGECPASLVWVVAGLDIEEPLCVLGDLVWLDDGDGIQEPGEPGIANVELSLTSSCDDSLLDVTSTDSEGFYLFDDLACDCTYTVTVNESSPALDGLDQTLVNQGDDECLDSDGVEATTTLTPLDPEDLCLDFGFVEPEGGGEGCTPGYWKQPQHFGSYANPPLPDTLFSAVFEDAFPGMTLVQVLAQGGGGLNALGRHTVAAMLNGASADVDYDLTDSEVISMFNDVYPGTKDEYNALKAVFSGFNEQMCPLGRADLDGDRPSRTRTRRVRR